MITPKSQRARQTQYIDDYILTHERGSHTRPLQISDAAFTQIPSDIPIDIGFRFKFENVEHRKILVPPIDDGPVAILVDPTGSIVGHTIRSGVFTGATVQYDKIRSEIQGSQVLLAPMMTENVTSVITPSAATIGVLAYLGTQHVYQPDKTWVDSPFNIGYYRGNDSSYGKFLCVRWNISVVKNFNLGTPTNYIENYSAGTVIDLVLYENGRIEYRLDKVNTAYSTGSVSASVVCGVWGSGTYRFRDFLYDLAPSNSGRTRHEYGGANYNAGFSYAGNPFASMYFTNWPVKDSNFAMMYVFQPKPPKRKQLPFVDVSKEHRNYDNVPYFDDRRTLMFSSASVYGANTLADRIFGDGTEGVSDRQDMFIDDIQYTGNQGTSVSELTLNGGVKNKYSAFSDVVFDMDDEFYVSGSVRNLSMNFLNPTHSKEVFSFDFPVNSKAPMYPTANNVFYYCPNHKGWYFPQNSIRVLNDFTSSALLSWYYKNAINPSDISQANLRAEADLSYVYDDTRLIARNALMFDAVGNLIASSSSNILYSVSSHMRTSGSTSYISGSDKSIVMKTVFDPYFDKSTTSHDDWEATQNESFSIDTKHPFLIEKIELEVPIEAGEDWFNDKTTSRLCIITQSRYTAGLNIAQANQFVSDFGGPGITFALFAQTNGNQPSGSTYRNLICSGVVTHGNDTLAYITASIYSASTVVSKSVTIQGYEGYATPGFVVPASSFWTGSIHLKMLAAVSNGVTVHTYFNTHNSGYYSNFLGKTPADKLEFLSETFLRTPILPLGNYDVAHFNSAGRGSYGFKGTSRSYFGRENGIAQDQITEAGYRNPFYVGLTGTLPVIPFDDVPERYHAYNVLMTDFESPYLLMPGDKLILAASKHRPAIQSITYGGGASVSEQFVTADGHDVKLSSGTIKLKIFGSYIRDEKEYHPPRRNLISTKNHFQLDSEVHDQFEVEYEDSFYGSYTDDFMYGDMLKILFVNNIQTIITGTNAYSEARIKLVSKIKSRPANVPESSLPTSAFPDRGISADEQVQPFYEKVGTQRFVRHSSQDEIYHDSLVPGPTDLFKRYNVLTYQSELISPYFLITFSFGNPTNGLSNNEWRWDFPFMPKLDGLTRIRNLNKAFSTHTLYDTTEIPFRYSNRAVIVDYCMLNDGLFGDLQESGISRLPFIDSSFGDSPYAQDIDAFEFYKAFYGFGDISGFKSSNSYGGINIPSVKVFSTTDLFALIRGWKYGLVSGIPTNTSCVFRRSRFGQFRDMLEGRPYTRFYDDQSSSQTQAAVNVRFVDYRKTITDPEKTWSSNISTYATSSLPFYDGESHNRPTINEALLNVTLTNATEDSFGNTLV